MTEASRYSAAWQDRKRRVAVFRTAQLLFLPLVGGAAFVCAKNPGAYNMSMLRSPFPVLAWFSGYLVADIWLNRFRCPRCGDLYFWKLEWMRRFWPQKSCI